MQSLKEKEEEIARLKVDLEIAKLKAELERLKVSSGYPSSSSSSSDTLTQFRQQQATKFDTKELSDEKLKILIKEEIIARLAIIEEESIEEAKIRLEIEELKEALKEVLKQNELEERAILKEIEEQLKRENAPLTSQEKTDLEKFLDDMQKKRRDDMKLKLINDDLLFDTLCRNIENVGIHGGKTLAWIAGKINRNADGGMIKKFNDLLDKRKGELYPPGQLHDHATQRKKIATLMLAAASIASAVSLATAGEAAGSVGIPGLIEIGKHIFSAACEARLIDILTGSVPCARHLVGIPRANRIANMNAARVEGVGVGSLAVSAAVVVGARLVRDFFKPKHKSIKGSFDLDREARAQGRIKVGYKVVSEKLKLS